MEAVTSLHISMLLTPAQKVIAKDTHRFRVVNCGRRFGKTTLAAEEIKGKVLYKASRIAYVAPTYQQSRDIMWELLKKELGPIATNINESRLEIKTLGKGGESLIILRGWESIETLRGQQFDFIVIDEIASMRNWKINWQEVIRPTLTDTQGSALFISTPKGFNHFYDLYNLERGDIDYKSFHFSSYDNPHLPIEELDKAKRELTEDRFSQEYLADFRRTEGLVYKEFDRERHIYGSTERLLYVPIERLVGVDWGYTNPSTVLLIEKDTDHKYWVKEEYYKTQKTTEEIVEYARALGGNKYYPDPAEPDRNEMLRRSGCNIREVSKDIEAGIQSVRELFKANRLFIHESCQNLIFELETYHYPEKKSDKNEPELPVKENDHALDAMRYVLYMQAPVGANNIAPVYYPQKTTSYHQSLNQQVGAPKPIHTIKEARTHYPQL